MSQPNNLKYAESHEWIAQDASGDLTVGITDHAQHLLGDVVFAELPEIGQYFTAKQACMLLESVKAASDIYMPVTGVIVAVNSALDDSPELINDDPFGQGWLFKISAENSADMNSLLSAQDYEASLDK